VIKVSPMTSVTSQAQQYSQRKLRLKRWVGPTWCMGIVAV